MTGSLTKRGKYWYVRVDMGKDPKTGKRIQRNINTKCTKKPDAEKVQAKIVNLINNGMFVDPNTITFIELLKIWLEDYVKINNQRTTYQINEFITNQHLQPYFKNIKLQKLSPMDIQHYYSTKLKEGLSESTVVRHHAVIHKALEYAKSKKLLNSNPDDFTDLPKQSKKSKGRALTVQETDRLLAAIKGESIETAVLLALTLGLRRGEVCGLKWRNINLDDGIVFVKETRVQFKEIIDKDKAKTDDSIRSLPLPKFLFDYLKNKKTKQKENMLMCGKQFKEDCYVCCWQDGTPFKPDYISKKFKKIIKKAELDESLRFHDLRHSNATFLLRQGVSLKEIQIWLGHSNIKTTMDIYTHVDVEMKKNVANKIDNVFQNSL